MLKNVSVSQVESFEFCARKWYLVKILKEEIPETPAQRAGKERGLMIHAMLENYYKRGVEPNPGTIERKYFDALRKHLPDRAPSIVNEQRFILPTYQGGPVWIGYIDMFDTLSTPTRVWDHKSIKDLRFAKAKHQLPSDMQLLVYVAALYLGAIAGVKPKLEYTQAGLVYVETRDVESREKLPTKYTPIDITKKQALEAYTSYMPYVMQMVELEAKRPPALEVIGNPASCNEYGGCFFRDYCSASKKSIFSIGGTNMGLLSNKSPVPNGTSTTVPVPVPSPSVEAIPATPAPAPPVAQVALPTPSAPIIPPDAPADAHRLPFKIGDEVIWNGSIKGKVLTIDGLHVGLSVDGKPCVAQSKDCELAPADEATVAPKEGSKLRKKAEKAASTAAATNTGPAQTVTQTTPITELLSEEVLSAIAKKAGDRILDEVSQQLEDLFSDLREAIFKRRQR